jgi:predicted kinase
VLSLPVELAYLFSLLLRFYVIENREPRREHIHKKRELKRKPECIIVTGLPGSGKSEVARIIGKKCRAKVYRTDVVRQEMDNPHDYSPKGKRAVYQKMGDLGAEKIKEGENVVFDGTFENNDDRVAIKKKVLEAGGTVTFVYVRAFQHIREQRIIGRTGTVSEATIASARQSQEIFAPHKERHIRINNNSTMHQLHKKISRYFPRRSGRYANPGIGL